MKAITFSEAQAEYAKTLDAVIDDQEEVVVTREGGRSVVIMPLDEYESLMETAHLLKSPANARRLLASVERLERGEGVVRISSNEGQLRRRRLGRLSVLAEQRPQGT
ncbi:hypothetical protein GCM10029992_64060 [Glycomyces albus]